jgi:hypothetical protein
MRKFRNVCNILGGRSERKRLLGSLMHILTEIVWD